MNIGVGTGGGGGGGGPRPPQCFTLETLVIFMHAAQIALIAVYIMLAPPPPKMESLPTPMMKNTKILA